jgi:hypothetical protein
MVKQIPMPPIGEGPLQVFKDCMNKGDSLEINFTDDGIFWGVPQGYFNPKDLPAYPGILVKNGIPFDSGTSIKTGDVALVYFDQKDGNVYICIMTIADPCQ